MLPNGYAPGKPCNTPPTTLQYGIPRAMPISSNVGDKVYYDAVPFYTSNGYNRVQSATCGATGWSISGHFNIDTLSTCAPLCENLGIINLFNFLFNELIDNHENSTPTGVCKVNIANETYKFYCDCPAGFVGQLCQYKQSNLGSAIGFWPLNLKSMRAMASRIRFQADDMSVSGNQMEIRHFGKSIRLISFPGELLFFRFSSYSWTIRTVIVWSLFQVSAIF